MKFQLNNVPEQPERGPFGYTIKVDGLVSIRCASTTARGAKLNALVLFFGVDAYQTGDWNDNIVNLVYANAVAQNPDHLFEIVAVRCVEAE